jgi:hypothetical protein
MEKPRTCIHLQNYPDYKLEYEAFKISDEAFKMILILCKKCVYERYTSKHLSGYKILTTPRMMTEATRRKLQQGIPF